jgi:putative molybdopterin biosynthesis protein
MTAHTRADTVRASFLDWQRCCLAAGWLPSLGTERVPVPEAVGRVTAAPVHARWSSPGHELAAMDGIAVRAAEVAGASPAVPARLGPEAFDLVDTGDPLPPGRDAVVMREHVTHLADGRVALVAPVRPGRHVRGVGEDVMAGELLLPSGHRLRPVDIAVVAGAGHCALPVRKRPRVAVLPTGDEVRAIGTEIGRGEILDTNSPMLAAMAHEAGCVPIRLPIVPDDRRALTAAVRAVADQVDLVLVIAGSSAGRDDHTAAVLAGLGEVVVHGVAMRPGHPVVLGLVKGHTTVPAIGVPGYPVSAAHVFDTFALPFLRMLEGTTPGARTAVPARLAHALVSRAGLDECHPVRLERRAGTDDLFAVPIGRGAGALSALMRADGLLRIPAGSTGLDAGAEVLVERLPGVPGRPIERTQASRPPGLPAATITATACGSGYADAVARP